jgi:hypothetical protein
VSSDADSDARLSSTEIAFITGVDNIKQIDLFLKELYANSATNVIFYEMSNRFEFIAAGNALSDLSIRLEEEMQKIDGYGALLDALQENAAAICIRKSYIINPSRDMLPVRKDLEGVIYRPVDILKSIDRETAGIDEDGKLLFVIPGFNDDSGSDLIDILKEKLLTAPANIGVAIPKYFLAQLKEI